MFEPNKPFYMTRAVSDELSQEHQQFIQRYIYENHEKLTDYLQIFEFYIEDGQQWLIKTQEEPDRETTIFVKLEEVLPINRKVWAMDQDDYIMLLFPSDY